MHVDFARAQRQTNQSNILNYKIYIYIYKLLYFYIFKWDNIYLSFYLVIINP